MSRHVQAIVFVAVVAAIVLVIRYVVGDEPTKGAAVAQVGNAIQHGPVDEHEPAGQKGGIRTIFSPHRPSASEWRKHVSFPSPVNSAKPPDTSAELPPASPKSPYSYVGWLERDGVRLLVLAHGDRILLKKQGEDVDSTFRLAAVEPPALLHVPTGLLLPVHRSPEATQPPSADSKGASLLAAQPTVAQPSHGQATNLAPSAAEIEADIAAALAAPAPNPIVHSSFPLAR